MSILHESVQPGQRENNNQTRFSTPLGPSLREKAGLILNNLASFAGTSAPLFFMPPFFVGGAYSAPIVNEHRPEGPLFKHHRGAFWSKRALCEQRVASNRRRNSLCLCAVYGAAQT